MTIADRHLRNPERVVLAGEELLPPLLRLANVDRRDPPLENRRAKGEEYEASL
jgi:hypothetical protein